LKKKNKKNIVFHLSKYKSVCPIFSSPTTTTKKKKTKMPTTCKKCQSRFDQPKALYDLKACREIFVNLIENNITSFSYTTPFANVGRYLNIAISGRGVPCSYVYKDWLSPRNGLMFFLEAETKITRNRYCVKCAYEDAYQAIDEALTLTA
jgi:hypothetical protein